ncbi:MAG: Trk system potassium transporter TrkA [Gammaproteobacteria bacterium]|nr:Trk system potassium transporter TrkA [Gammaproteobacteria bacterium]
MRIIILGASEVGENLARVLVAEDNDVILIDENNKRLDEVKQRLDVQTVTGSASHPRILINAGIEQAELVIAVTPNDEINMISALIAIKIFDVPKIIARISSEDYHQHPELFAKNVIPIKTLIYPTELIIDHIVRVIEYPDFFQIFNFYNDAVCMVSFEIQSQDWMNGQTIAAVKEKLSDVHVAIVAIFQKKQCVPISDTYTLILKDKLLCILPTSVIPIFLKALKRTTHAHRRIMIAGGGPIGTGLAKRLEAYHQTKLIEHTDEQIEQDVAQLDQTIVLQGDIADRDLLVNENIDDMDIFCAVTSDDEANIMSSLQAKYLGANYAMSLVNRESYIDLIEDSLIDHALSPQYITVGNILSKIRHGNMIKIHRLQEDEAEAIELIVEGDESSSSVIGRPISEIEFPPHCTVAGVIRKNKLVLQYADLVLAANDHVILLLLKKRYIHQLEALFQVNLTFMS